MSQPPQIETSEAPRRLSRAAKIVIALSCLNLLALCVVSYLLYGLTDIWWVSTVLTYAPRAPYLVPSIVLLVSSLLWHRESAGINLISLAIVLVPIMGLVLPLDRWMNGVPTSTEATRLRIVSCNVQGFKPDFDRVLQEIDEHHPDIVALQEAFGGDPRFNAHFPDWHFVHHVHYWIGSRYPITHLKNCEVSQFGSRTAGMIVSIELPEGPVIFADIHQMTARFGLRELNEKTLITGDGIQELEAFEGERYLESIDIRETVNSVCEHQPLIVCGDFNAPTSCRLFQRHWGDLQSSFDLAGLGYGYTSPCKGNKLWPDNRPWARIDHILCSNDWHVLESKIGHSDGSDHRLITSTIMLRQTKR